MRNRVFTQSVQANKRLYAIDVLKTQYGDYYLNISEITERYNDTRRSNILIFQEDIENFAQAFQKVLSHLEHLSKTTPIASSQPSPSSISRTERTPIQWTPMRREALEILHAHGKSIPNMAAYFRCSEQDIRHKIQQFQL